VADALAPDSIQRRGLFSPDEIGRLYQGFRQGVCDHSVIWQLVMLELWMRTALDPKRASRPGSSAQLVCEDAQGPRKPDDQYPLAP
jgi:hypothetical protein